MFPIICHIFQNEAKMVTGATECSYFQGKKKKYFPNLIKKLNA